MNWLKKLKKGLQVRDEQMREQRLVKQHSMVSLAHQCMRCKYFVYREERPRNWVCRCPDDRLRFKGSVCLGFEYGEHPEMVIMNSR